MVDIFPPRGMPGQTAENWARSAENRIISAESAITTLEQNSAGDNRAMASQIQQLTDLVNSMPLVRSAASRATGFGITGSYGTYASVSVTVPSGKRSMSIMVIGSGAVLDATTGGVTTAYGRCVVGSDVGGEFPASKDAGASQVNNVITATHAGSYAVAPGGVITIAFQMYGLNGSAFPARVSNFAQVSVVATFSN